MGDEATGCFSCLAEADGKDWIETIAAGSMFNPDAKHKQTTTWQSKLAAAFFILNFILTIVDAVFGGVSIRESFKQVEEGVELPNVTTTEDFWSFHTSTALPWWMDGWRVPQPEQTTAKPQVGEAILNYPKLFFQNSNIPVTSTLPALFVSGWTQGSKQFLVAGSAYVTPSTAALKTHFTESANATAINGTVGGEHDDGLSFLYIWLYSYVVFCSIYLPFELIMLIYMLFGFRSLVFKCRKLIKWTHKPQANDIALSADKVSRDGERVVSLDGNQQLHNSNEFIESRSSQHIHCSLHSVQSETSPAPPYMPGIHEVDLENIDPDLKHGCKDRHCSCFSKNDDLKEILVELMLAFESILVNLMGYGQLAFSQSSPTNRYIFTEGLNSAETSGFLSVTSIVSYFISFSHLFKARNRMLSANRGWKPKVKFAFRLLEFMMSGIAMTTVVMVFSVAKGVDLIIVYDNLIVTIVVWSLISHAFTLCLFTDRGRDVCKWL